MMTKQLLVTASALAIGVGLGRMLWSLGARDAPVGRADWSAPTEGCAQPLDTAAVTRNFLLYFVVPVWSAAGVADWLCHRATDIEHTGGTRESLLHLLMLLEMGIPVVAGLLFEITSPVIALMIASLLLHEATALADVSYAIERRYVGPLEQHVHSFLEMMPLMALSFILCLHWPQFLGLLRGTSGGSETAISLKREPLSTRYVSTVLGATVLFQGGPYLEELWRCLRAERSADGWSRPTLPVA